MREAPLMSQYPRAARRVMLAIVLLCLVLPLPVLSAEPFTGKVVGISDGDTISVLREGKGSKCGCMAWMLPRRPKPLARRHASSLGTWSSSRLSRRLYAPPTATAARFDT